MLIKEIPNYISRVTYLRDKSFMDNKSVEQMPTPHYDTWFT